MRFIKKVTRYPTGSGCVEFNRHVGIFEGKEFAEEMNSIRC